MIVNRSSDRCSRHASGSASDVSTFRGGEGAGPDACHIRCHATRGDFACGGERRLEPRTVSARTFELWKRELSKGKEVVLREITLATLWSSFPSQTSKCGGSMNPRHRQTSCMHLVQCELVPSCAFAMATAWKNACFRRSV